MGSREGEGPCADIRHGFLTWDLGAGAVVDLNKPTFFAGTLFTPRAVCHNCGRRVDAPIEIHPWTDGVYFDDNDEEDEDW